MSKYKKSDIVIPNTPAGSIKPAATTKLKELAKRELKKPEKRSVENLRLCRKATRYIVTKALIVNDMLEESESPKMPRSILI